MLLKIYNQKLFKYFPTVPLSMHHNTVYAQCIITMVIIYNVFQQVHYDHTMATCVTMTTS